MANVCVDFEVLKGVTPEHTREGNLNQDLNMSKYT